MDIQEKDIGYLHLKLVQKVLKVLKGYKVIKDFKVI
jgi:hypothetical protein